MVRHLRATPHRSFLAEWVGAGGSLEIFQLSAERRYERVVGATSGVLDPVPGCEGLILDLDALWSELERLDPEG